MRSEHPLTYHGGFYRNLEDGTFHYEDPLPYPGGPPGPTEMNPAVFPTYYGPDTMLPNLGHWAEYYQGHS